MPQSSGRKEPKRYRLEDERQGVTWKLVIGDLKGVQLGTEKKPPEGHGYFVKAFLTTGEYPDGALGEAFITPDKEGSFVKGVLDGFALLLSIALQHGIPLEEITSKFLHMRFDPSGYTTDDSVPSASSFFDFMFRKLGLRYLEKDELEQLGIEDRAKPKANSACQEEPDASWKETSSQRPTAGLSGEPFNQKIRREETLESGSDASDGEEAREGGGQAPAAEG